MACRTASALPRLCARRRARARRPRTGPPARARDGAPCAGAPPSPGLRDHARGVPRERHPRRTGRALGAKRSAARARDRTRRAPAHATQRRRGGWICSRGATARWRFASQTAQCPPPSASSTAPPSPTRCTSTTWPRRSRRRGRAGGVLVLCTSYRARRGARRAGARAHRAHARHAPCEQARGVPGRLAGRCCSRLRPGAG